MVTKKKTTKKVATKKQTATKASAPKTRAATKKQSTKKSKPSVDEPVEKSSTDTIEPNRIETVPKRDSQHDEQWYVEASKQAASCPNHVLVKLSKQLKSRLKFTAESEGVEVVDLVEELLAESVVLRAWEIMQRKGAMRGDSSGNSFGGNRVQGSNNYRPQQNQRHHQRGSNRQNRNKQGGNNNRYNNNNR